MLPKSKALNIPLDLRSNIYLCSWALMRTRSWIQAPEMSFLLRLAGRSLRDGGEARSPAELWVEPLLLHNKRSQLSWFGHLIQMPPRGGPGHAGETTSPGLETPRLPHALRDNCIYDGQTCAFGLTVHENAYSRHTFLSWWKFNLVFFFQVAE